jgi:uncharacterized RDD family membrane protein YckC
MAKIGVETAQHVELNYKPATAVERILAYLLDGLILAFYWIGLTFLGDSASSPIPESSDGGILFGVLVLFLPVWLYHLIIEILWNGYSVGKYLVGIRVVRIDGTRPGVVNYLIRWFLRLFEVTLTSGGLALLAILINGKGQRIGDVAAKTCVIKVRRQTTLSETVLENVQSDYKPVYSQVRELNDDDISVINEVLKSQHQYEYETWIRMVKKTSEKTRLKMGISSTPTGSLQFLKQVLKDYNALHGVLE